MVIRPRNEVRIIQIGFAVIVVLMIAFIMAFSLSKETPGKSGCDEVVRTSDGALICEVFLRPSTPTDEVHVEVYTNQGI